MNCPSKTNIWTPHPHYVRCTLKVLGYNNLAAPNPASRPAYSYTYTYTYTYTLPVSTEDKAEDGKEEEKPGDEESEEERRTKYVVYLKDYKTFKVALTFPRDTAPMVPPVIGIIVRRSCWFYVLRTRPSRSSNSTRT